MENFLLAVALIAMAGVIFIQAYTIRRLRRLLRIEHERGEQWRLCATRTGVRQ